MRPIERIDIDRMVLTDLAVTPAQAERIRALVAHELRSLLERQGTVEPVESGDTPYLLAPTMQLAGLKNDQRLATSLARSIAQALHGSGERKEP